jgi:hypothetical protein
MADSHAFELRVHRGALPDLVHAINRQLAPESQPLTDDALVAARNIPLSFHFREDATLAMLTAEYPELRVSPSVVAFGHVYASATPHGDMLDISFYSTSHALAAAMRESTQVRAWFRSLAVHAVDAQVHAVDEWHASRPL